MSTKGYLHMQQIKIIISEYAFILPYVDVDWVV